MTDTEILQSRYDHANLRLDIISLVQRGTPTRWSMPVRTQRVSRKFTIAYVHDYIEGGLLAVGYEHS